MNKWKALAILFSLLTFGALKESLRIFTSSAPDIAGNRTELIIMTVVLTGVLFFFTIRFWRKASSNQRS
jgi:hypothetical protein